MPRGSPSRAPSPRCWRTGSRPTAPWFCPQRWHPTWERTGSVPPEMTAAASGRDWARALNAEQREAVAHVDGPLLVLAGAGSGKTRVLTTRIAALIEEHGVRAERIFAVTFTNKAAGEMKQRVATLLARDPAGLWIGTFHSLSARMLRRDAERLGWSRQFTIFDEDDRLGLIRRLLEERNVQIG